MSGGIAAVRISTALSACGHSDQGILLASHTKLPEEYGLSGYARFGEQHAITRDGVVAETCSWSDSLTHMNAVDGTTSRISIPGDRESEIERTELSWRIKLPKSARTYHASAKFEMEPSTADKSVATQAVKMCKSRVTATTRCVRSYFDTSRLEVSLTWPADNEDGRS